MLGYDLRDEPWIPVRLRSGEQMRFGFRELLRRAHEIADLELPVPPAASGLLRILAVMTASIGGQRGMRLDGTGTARDAASWYALRQRVLDQGLFDPEAVDSYFDDPSRSGRFDLFSDDYPFLQDPRLLKECVDSKGAPNPSGVNKLVFGRPTGINGAVLFGHFTDREPVPVPAAEAAWHLIAQLYFGPSGQCTPRRITEERAGSGDAAPLRKSISYFPWAPDLFTTLVLAVPSPQTGADREAQDFAAWEGELLHPLKPLPPPTSPRRLLTGRFRHAVLLVPSADRRTATDAYITWSTHDKPAPAWDPFQILERRKDGEFQPREADGARALWRDLDSLLLKDSRRDVQRPPALEYLPRNLRSQLRVRAYGFDQDGQQKDSVWFQATTPPVLQWQEEADRAMAYHVRRCHTAAEETGERLEFAAMVAWRIASDSGTDISPKAKIKIDRRKPGPWAAAARSLYWPAAEREFWKLTAPQEAADPVERPFVQAALDCLDEAIGPANRADIRVARARNRARAILLGLLPRPAAD
ncbi:MULTISPECIES: type I-E CRISPR-associated protein Cse1/CasA [Streptomyces]|uniref:Type I-E CRISPR-associated protein Cse1/CasA n=1 Tax=Streptomyces tsukubensis (strain DSM 42081 / NBRC 108919 / NRRL 18488 / 9993) TaxID=1114943 RepID=I2N802_STRT9|nr:MULTISPECIES: type I-E CRISPR-associated protein Cse1/CasA [Streptomyces]AZK97017.1 type I-E CRISPR-associated protein Cse1/CasA [Streptomyces tsukubensis]EIF93149.1 CRISPR-associated Cse1 family protein [Streptomyces tsukubensis NRRL18488]MYS66546.1 type I-E CRISPR-associated protein Cse1/CasA [Streptomyces sp. SID5473]QKM71443.1 type I-E CRISPR-associated protein Cse1/CasA [Streptomyces tsukubensis NRRL18488]TAI41517.1 type I-E CRISPR-associated protein Cse1/CasA [Streptomyces tsukubensis